jgi:hypothetical protein
MSRMSRNVYVVRLRRRSRRATRGQSLVEFAIVSIVLLMLILGIIEIGRLLFVYSVVSNAAHEGVRYGIIRPQDMYAQYEMRTRVAQGTTIPTVLVVPDGNCNIVDKAREKVWGIPRNELIVHVWFDDGSGVPTMVPTNIDEITDLVPYTGPQNRIAVETSYRYQFIVPFVSAFAPSGITIKMRAARTIENFEFDQRNCTMSLTPAPTPPPPPTRTSTPTNTPRPTFTATNTPTMPPATRTPTGTRTPTVTVTLTATRTPTVTRTATITVTPSVTRTSTPGPSPTRSNTPVPPTVTHTSTPAPPTVTRTNTPVPPTATVTRTPVPPTLTTTSTPSPTSTTVISVPSPITTGTVP